MAIPGQIQALEQGTRAIPVRARTSARTSARTVPDQCQYDRMLEIG